MVQQPKRFGTSQNKTSSSDVKGAISEKERIQRLNEAIQRAFDTGDWSEFIVQGSVGYGKTMRLSDILKEYRK